MVKFTLGIRGQLIAGIVLTTLAGIALIGLLAIKIVESRSVYWKVAEADHLVAFIRAAAVKESDSADTPQSLDFIGTALRDMGVKDFRLASSSGQLLLEGGALPEDTGTVLSYSGGLEVNRIGGGVFSGPPEMLYVKTTTGVARGINITFALPLTDIKRDMAGVRRFLFFYVILDSVIIVAFGLYYLSRSITGPIRRLEVAATRIAGGEYSERVDLSVDNEIGSLAASFNTMAERIEAEIVEMERVNTELVSTQEELLRSSTLAAVGRLAAGIAHEIGNPLGAVRGYMDILGSGGDLSEEQSEVVDRAAKEVSRIDSILREFLDIARPSKEAPGPVDVNSLMEDTVSTLDAHKEFSMGSVSMELTPGLPPVVMDAGKLRQVFLNLLLNALQSLDETKPDNAVTVKTGLSDDRADNAMGPLRRSSDRVEDRGCVFISVTDTGTGVSAEDAQKIFGPFFTTKEVGAGTGLGLFVSQGIIRTYGGEIDLSSGEGSGSTFTVRLPFARSET